MAYGIDISEHQRGYDDFDRWDFAIFRARNENGRDDYQFGAHWSNSEGRTLRGIYGWPIANAGYGANRAAGQALVRDFPRSEFGYWADVESSPRGHASPEDVEGYVQGILDAGGHAGIYSNIGDLVRSPVLDALPWWMADYGPNDGQQHDPNEQAPRPPGDRPWAIHQFTSAGGLDVNYAPTLDLWGDLPADTSEEDDMANFYITKQSDPSVGIWITDDIVKRHVGPWEWGTKGTDIFGNPIDPPIVWPVDDVRWDSYPDVNAPAPGVSLDLTGIATTEQVEAAVSNQTHWLATTLSKMFSIRWRKTEK